MGMPIEVEIVGEPIGGKEGITAVFDYFKYVDEKFSTYKKTSEISKINNGEIEKNDWSEDMKKVFELAGETSRLTFGYFDILDSDGKYDPLGLVKGWAIYNASMMLEGEGFKNFYIDAGGDIQVKGKNNEGNDWRIGIKNPFNEKEIVKVVFVSDRGVATSGTYIRGQHIYNPKARREPIEDIVSLTVVGPNIFEADRFATAAFAMGKDGINFIQELNGFEGYVIDRNGVATMTDDFIKYTKANAK